MIICTKIRIYPNLEQKEKLERVFGCARWFWNNSLLETQKVYKETGKGLGQYSFNARLPSLKKEFAWLSEAHSQVLQSVSLNLSRAFINFFERRSEFPCFKKKNSRQSIQYPQGVRIVDGKKIVIPKIGNIVAVVHREIIGAIKTVTVSKSSTGKYFASVLSENGCDIPGINCDGKTIGVDVGLTHLVVTSDGSKYENPRFLLRAEKNLRRKQQKLSRKVKGSHGRDRARLLVAKANEKIANARKDWQHKLSRRLVNENQVIAVEDLNIKGMMQNHNLAKSIGDAGWGSIVTFIKYKAENDGKCLIKVNRFFASSKICNNCLHKQEKMPLNIRSWKCGRCSSVNDRDINASKNIRDEALRMIAAGTAVTAVGGVVSRCRGRKSSVIANPNENRISF